MERKRFEQSVRRIYATGDNEIDCEAVQALLPAYVEFEIEGSDPAERFPNVQPHLLQCPDCAEEHRGLRQVTRLEARGELPEADDIMAQFEPEPASEPDKPSPASTPQPNR